MIKIKMNESLVVREKTKSMPKECIRGATLLSSDEVMRLLTYEERKRKYNGEPWSYWTRTAIYENNYAGVVKDNGRDYYYIVNYAFVGVRPALILNLQSSNLKVGDRFGFGGYKFKIISKDLAICEEIIGQCAFREDRKAEDANVYEASDVKKYVDNWFDNAYAEYEAFDGKKSMPKECIRGATLLNSDEAASLLTYEERKREYNEEPWSYWTRSQGHYDTQAGVVTDKGRTFEYSWVGYNCIGVRPALILDVQSSSLGIGDSFEFGGYDFKIISREYAICEEIIGQSAFREDYKAEDANVYEKSDVKKCIDSWFDRAYSEYEG